MLLSILPSILQAGIPNSGDLVIFAEYFQQALQGLPDRIGPLISGRIGMSAASELLGQLTNIEIALGPYAHIDLTVPDLLDHGRNFRFLY